MKKTLNGYQTKEFWETFSIFILKKVKKDAIIPNMVVLITINNLPGIKVFGFYSSIQ